MEIARYKKDLEMDTDLDTPSLDLDTNLGTALPDLDTNQPMSLNEKQKDLIDFCAIPRSSKEILERVGVSNHTKNREKYIKTLLEAGYLEMTNPKNPNASNQKYRKTSKK